jgi:hypothetical protein
MVDSAIGGGNRNPRRKPPTCRKSLINTINLRETGKIGYTRKKKFAAIDDQVVWVLCGL